MDTTATAPFGVITNTELPARDPSFRPIASRMGERKWVGVIVNDITLGLEARCRIVPPGDMRALKITNFPEDFDNLMNNIIRDIKATDLNMVFRKQSIRQRLPSVHRGDMDDMRVGNCRGLDRLWRVPIQTYRSSEQLGEELMIMRTRVEPYLTAFKDWRWHANLQVIIYTEPPITKPQWFSDFEYTRNLEWDSTPWGKVE